MVGVGTTKVDAVNHWGPEQVGFLFVVAVAYRLRVEDLLLEA